MKVPFKNEREIKTFFPDREKQKVVYLKPKYNQFERKFFSNTNKTPGENLCLHK